MDGEMVQGQAGDPRKAESQDRPMGRIAGTDSMGPGHRRCDSHSTGILQDPAVLDHGPASYREIHQIPGVEPGVWIVIGCLQPGMS